MFHQPNLLQLLNIPEVFLIPVIPLDLLRSTIYIIGIQKDMNLVLETKLREKNK